MAMKRCPVCGEKYSHTAGECPFCKEDARRKSEEKPAKNCSGKRPAKPSKQFRVLVSTRMLSIVIVSASLIYLLREGVRWADDSVKKPSETLPHHTEEQVPQTEREPQRISAEPKEQRPDGPDDSSSLDYETASKLPDGLSLSSVEFMLENLGQTYTIRAFGGSANGYAWLSEDNGVVSVDRNGKVKALSGGTTHVLATDGSRKAVCIVHVNVSHTPEEQPGDGDSGNGSGAASELKAGFAEVVNAETGVRVRSGPGTDYKALISIYNGAKIQVVKSVEEDWYEIIFYNARGVETTGYMKGEFLKNN